MTAVKYPKMVTLVPSALHSSAHFGIFHHGSTDSFSAYHPSSGQCQWEWV